MEGERESTHRRESGGGETREERKRRKEEKRLRHEARRARRKAREEASASSPPTKRPRKDGEQCPDEAPRSDDGLFVWKKKVELQRRRGEPVRELDEARRREELAEELAAAKRRRAERDAERAAWETEQAALAREREQEQNAGWYRAEETFHGAQHFLRQAIRLRQGRPVGTDALARNLRLDLLDLAPDDVDPVARLAEIGMGGAAELERMAEDVEKELDYVPDFETEGDNDVFNRNVRLAWWECVRTCSLSMLEDVRTNASYGGAGGVHNAVEGELDAMLQGKSLHKLLEMEGEISKRLASGANASTGQDQTDDGFAEVDFWTSALARIRRLVAELRLKDMNGVLIQERGKRMAAVPKDKQSTDKKDSKVNDDGTATELEMLQNEVARGMGADEEKFADEVEVATKKRQVPAAGYAWNDKYRPRKPRYYNRVHTGYDWTKYNRTHYDRDNPPPKTVQGYRFNIFYPDLIDPSKTPTFTISKTDNPEVCIITFKAGPPYEDLAFKIVNRPWEHSHRRGYRCSFDRGILQMWFNFQRYRYRR